MDVTQALAGFAERQTALLDGVSGYVFMERSPSCGLDSVKVRATVRGEPLRCNGRGVYAAAIVKRRPDLPVEESGRLHDAGVRQAFVQRVSAHAHWLCLLGAGLTPQRLLEFHVRYKYLLMAHSVTHYQCAGRLLANLKGGLQAIGESYFICLMAGLSRPTAATGHANALFHMQGYFRGRLSSAERRHLGAAIERCRVGAASVGEARSLMLRLLRRHPHPYLLKQVYLSPSF